MGLCNSLRLQEFGTGDVVSQKKLKLYLLNIFANDLIKGGIPDM